MTYGEFKKLNVPDETPVVIRSADDFAYEEVTGGQIVAVCPGGSPGDPAVTFFDPEDRRATGFARQVLLIG